MTNMLKDIAGALKKMSVTETKMSAADKAAAREVHDVLKRDEPMASGPGLSIKAKHSALRKKYGSDWRKKAGIEEGAEQIDEISSDLAKRYIKKAQPEAEKHGEIYNKEYWAKQRKRHPSDGDVQNSDLSKRALRSGRKMVNREDGVWRAKKIVAKEEVGQIDELSARTLTSYAGKARDDVLGRPAGYEKKFNRINGAHKAKVLAAKKQKMKEDAEMPDNDILPMPSLMELSKGALGRYASRAMNDVRNSNLAVGRRDKGMNHTPSDPKEAEYHKQNKRTAKNREAGVRRAIARLTREGLEGQESAETVSGPASSVQASKDNNEPKNSSATPDTSRLNKVDSPVEVDGKKAVDTTHANVKASAQKATQDVKTESYDSNTSKHVKRMTDLVREISGMVNKINSDHGKAMAAKTAATKSTASVGSSAVADIGKYAHGAKDHARSLEDVRDGLERSMNEQKKPFTIAKAFRMMEERDRHLAGATPPEGIADKWSGKALEFAQMHVVEEPEEADINVAVQKNKTEVEASLRRSVDYRNNDQTIGDRKPVGNDAK